MKFSEKLSSFDHIPPVPESIIGKYMSGFSDGTGLPREYLDSLQSSTNPPPPHYTDFWFASPSLFPYMVRMGLQILIDPTVFSGFPKKDRHVPTIAFFDIIGVDCSYSEDEELCIRDDPDFPREKRWEMRRRLRRLTKHMTAEQMQTTAAILREVAENEAHRYRQHARAALDIFWADYEFQHD